MLEWSLYEVCLFFFSFLHVETSFRMYLYNSTRCRFVIPPLIIPSISNNFDLENTTKLGCSVSEDPGAS